MKIGLSQDYAAGMIQKLKQLSMNNLNAHVCGMYVSHGCTVYACMSGVNIGKVFLYMYLTRQITTGTTPDSAITEDKNRVNLHAITISFTVRLATLNKSK